MMNLETTTNLLLYQVDAVNKLLPTRLGGLFMAMGTGKTRTIIELIKLRQHKIDKVVYFCPVSLKDTVRQEIFKHTNLTGSDVYIFGARTNERNLPEAFIYIVGIESMSSSARVIFAVNQLVTENTFVVLDESSFIKGHYALRTERITEICGRAKYRCILTGTPLSQGVVDLFSQMYFLSPKILGYNSFYSFAANHLEYSDRFPGLIVRSHNLEYIAAKVKPYTYQVTKEEALNLPEKLYETRYFYMSRQQWQWYCNVKDSILQDWETTDDPSLSSIMIFRLFSSLQQVVSGFYNERLDRIRRRVKAKDKRFAFHEFENPRLDKLSDVVYDIPKSDKAVIFCKFIYDLDMIKSRLESEHGPGCCATFHGGLSESERVEQINIFKTTDTRFFIATIASGGHGLNLQDAAHYVIFYNNVFKYSERMQAEDRCHRIGQKFPVTYVDIECMDSIDEKIAKAISKKGGVVREFQREIDKVKKEKIKELIKKL